MVKENRKNNEEYSELGDQVGEYFLNILEKKIVEFS